jgi:hypothetical protein
LENLQKWTQYAKPNTLRPAKPARGKFGKKTSDNVAGSMHFSPFAE